MIKREVHFRSSAFNGAEVKDYFINNCCFGDDVARWLIKQLVEQGLNITDEPGQEDFGWYFNFDMGGIEHCFVIALQQHDTVNGDEWVGWLERKRGFLGSLFGGRKRGIMLEALQGIDNALKSSPEIWHVIWHEPGADDEAVQTHA